MTGLIVNGKEHPRVPKTTKDVKLALYNAQQGITVDNALEIEQLIGHSAFVYMTDSEYGKSLLDAFQLLKKNSDISFIGYIYIKFRLHLRM